MLFSAKDFNERNFKKQKEPERAGFKAEAKPACGSEAIGDKSDSGLQVY